MHTRKRSFVSQISFNRQETIDATASQLAEYISACFTGLWIQSHEHEDALTQIAQMCTAENWRLVVWDVNRGLTIQRQNEASVDTGTNDPLAAIRSLDATAKTLLPVTA